MANTATEQLADLAKVFKALGHPTRLWIVRNLAKGEMCVNDFVTGTQSEFSAVSQHLTVLKNANIVKCKKRGKHVFYKLTYISIPWFIDCIEERNRLPPHIREDQIELAEKYRKDLITRLENLVID